MASTALHVRTLNPREAARNADRNEKLGVPVFHSHLSAELEKQELELIGVPAGVCGQPAHPDTVARLLVAAREAAGPAQ